MNYSTPWLALLAWERGLQQLLALLAWERGYLLASWCSAGCVYT